MTSEPLNLEPLTFVSSLPLVPLQIPLSCFLPYYQHSPYSPSVALFHESYSKNACIYCSVSPTFHYNNNYNTLSPSWYSLFACVDDFQLLLNQMILNKPENEVVTQKGRA